MKFYINPNSQNIVRSISTIIAEITIPYFLINGFIAERLETKRLTINNFTINIVLINPHLNQRLSIVED